MAKLDRSTFLYLDPETDYGFAQCLTCRDWVEDDNLCVIHGPMITVTETMSCGFYVYGDPHEESEATFFGVSPRESGLVDREVRCENCRHLVEESTCGFFKTLNETIPELFDLDTHVDPKGCCNAQQAPTN